MDTTPRRTLLLARISSARNGDERGVTDQLADMRVLARRLRWQPGPQASHEVVENDTSAFRRRVIELPDGSTGLRTVRPEFRRALAMLQSGEADGLLAYDLDRLARDPRDLEDLIDVVEAHPQRVPVESVTGSLRLANDADVSMARIMVSIANKSSRDTARRVSRARLRQAQAGSFGGGSRRYGYTPDGMGLVPREAAVIRRCADALLAGASLRSVTRDLRQEGIPSVSGAAWSPESLRSVLLKPSVAGIAVHRGKRWGVAAGPRSWSWTTGGPWWRCFSRPSGPPRRAQRRAGWAAVSTVAASATTAPPCGSRGGASTAAGAERT